MRKINRFVICRGFGNTYEDMVSLSKSIGLEYPMAHYFIDIGKNDEIFIFRGRPLKSNCALLRDSFLMEHGIGIVVQSNETKIPYSASKRISKIIKDLIDDLGIEDYRIISDELDEEHRVNISNISPDVLQSEFSKL